MDGIGPIAQKLFPSTPRLEKPSKDEKQSFQIEAATIELSAKLNYVQLGNQSADNTSELLDKVRQWVQDIFEKNGIEWKDLSPDEAKKQTDDGGEQSPDAVSKRILDFVKGFDDGTDGRRQLLRDAVEQGFKEAEGTWGSKLPDISYTTMDKVHAGLDQMFAKPKVDVAA
jgi:hypothetical protein